MDGKIRKRKWFPLEFCTENLFKETRVNEMQKALKKSLSFFDNK